MNAFAWTIGVGAFLIFQVQPLLARFILPSFGGGAAVWTACLLFFQTFLLVGYAYAHASSRWLGPRGQVALHLALVGLSIPFLPIAPGTAWQPTATGEPTWQIFLLLTATIGLPYLALAATAPLVQNWFGRVHPTQAPYRLYALSNAGALAALVSYPFVFEPLLSRHTIATIWAGGFALYATLVAACAASLWRWQSSSSAIADVTSAAGNASGQRSTGNEESQSPTTGTMALWLALSACSSALLMSLTNKLCQDLAAVPFLWVLPLALYLLTFILCFERQAWYRRGIFTLLLPTVAALLCWQSARGDRPLHELIGIYCSGLFVACMVCHGELYRLRPAADRQTTFFLMIAAGGVIGGLFVAVAAPLLFTTYAELAYSLCLLGGLLAVIHHHDRTTLSVAGRPRPVWPAIGVGTAALAAGFFLPAWWESDGILARSRTFYGTLRVEDVCRDDPALHGHRLMHGVTNHGAQFVDPLKARIPLTYYGESSGVGMAITHLPAEAGRRIGVVGLGAGTLATYGRQGDTMRFYEIDSAVEPIARRWFSYLQDSAATIEVAIGDGRLLLDHEDNQHFDLLVLDAFSSDAIPIHLLTLEAFATYLRHLQPHGVIAIHISNRHLDLCRVTAGTVEHFLKQGTQLYLGYVPHPVGNEQLPPGINESVWILLTRDRGFLEQPAISSRCLRPPERSLQPVIWTDDHASLWSVLRD